MLKQLKINHKYEVNESLYYIIREDKHFYYIIDDVAHLCIERFYAPNFKNYNTSEISCFEIEKNYDSEYKLKQFLKEAGVDFV